MGGKVEMIGKRYGRLVVLKESDKRDRNGNVHYECVCDCGNVKTISGVSLRRGATQSCGCLNKEINTKEHPYHKEKLYRVYASIKARCFNKNEKAYRNYGGRGITMCGEWLHSFETFKDWAMENGYKENLTIDRINNNGDYEPTNCRWVTMKEQQRNKRTNRIVEIDGVKKTVVEWCEQSGISYSTFMARLKNGWSGRALIKPADQYYNRNGKTIHSRNHRF